MPRAAYALIGNFRKRRRLLHVAVVAVVTVAPLASCSGEDPSTLNTTTARRADARIIDVSAGSYRGVRVGSNRDVVRAKLGRGDTQGSPTTLANPKGEDGSPPVIGLQRKRGLHSISKYRHVIAFLADRRVHTLLIDDPRATTAEGVAIGDPLDRVEERYADAVCGTVNENTEYEPYPACYIKRGKLYAWFGLDPIRSITVSETTLDDLTPE